MGITLKRRRRPTGDITTVEITREAHTRLRSLADEQGVQIRDLTDYLIVTGLDRVKREGLPVAG